MRRLRNLAQNTGYVRIGPVLHMVYSQKAYFKQKQASIAIDYVVLLLESTFTVKYKQCVANKIVFHSVGVSAIPSVLHGDSAPFRR